MFHHFHGGTLQATGQGSLNSQNFRKILFYLKKNFKILKPSEWIKKITTNKLKPNEICLTFDDALLSQYKIALKEMDKLDLKAFWFIYSSVFEGQIDNFEIHRKFRTLFYRDFKDFFLHFESFLKGKKNYYDNSKFKKYYSTIKKKIPIYSLNDIKFRFLRNYIIKEKNYNLILEKMMKEKKTNKKSLSKNLWLKNHHLKILSNKGHEIGLHCYNHPYLLEKLSYSNQKKQLIKNYNHIFKVTKKKPICISYPNGSFNKNTIKIIKNLNLKFAFISNMYAKKNIVKNYVIPRVDHSTLLKKLTK